MKIISFVVAREVALSLRIALFNYGAGH